MQLAFSQLEFSGFWRLTSLKLVTSSWGGVGRGRRELNREAGGKMV